MASRYGPLLCFCACALGGLAFVAPARGGCNSYGGYGYYSYPSYSYPSYSYPVYNTKVIIRERFIPISIYGSQYLGPTSVASYLQQQSSGVAGGAAVAAGGAGGAGGVSNSDFARLTKLTEGIATGVGALRTEVSGVRADLNQLRTRMDSHEVRMRVVEARLGTVPPSPVSPPSSAGPAAAPAPAGPGAGAPGPVPAPPRGDAPKRDDTPGPAERGEVALPDPLTVAVAKCALCHQEGSKSNNADTQRQITKGLKVFVMLTKDGKAAPLDAAGSLAFNDVMLAGTMPPKAGKGADGKPTHSITPLTQAEGESLFRARPTWPKRMDAAKE